MKKDSTISKTELVILSGEKMVLYVFLTSPSRVNFVGVGNKNLQQGNNASTVNILVLSSLVGRYIVQCLTHYLF